MAHVEAEMVKRLSLYGEETTCRETLILNDVRPLLYRIGHAPEARNPNLTFLSFSPNSTLKRKRKQTYSRLGGPTSLVSRSVSFESQ